MSIRWATGVLVAAAIVLVAQSSWAIRQGLPPSKDEWGLKYHVEVAEAGDNLNVTFTLADQGRLKPIYSIDLVAFSKQTDNQGGRSYDVLEPIKLTKTADGKQVGQASFNKQHLDRAKIRIITLHVDGKRQPSGGVFLDIPVAKYWNTTTAAKPR
jgi:hypothetical protein